MSHVTLEITVPTFVSPLVRAPPPPSGTEFITRIQILDTTNILINLEFYSLKHVQNICKKLSLFFGIEISVHKWINMIPPN